LADQADAGEVIFRVRHFLVDVILFVSYNVIPSGNRSDSPGIMPFMASYFSSFMKQSLKVTTKSGVIV
jgi:hypothetical protein